MPKPTRLRIGDIVLAFIPDRPNREFSVEDAYSNFVTSDSPDVILRVHCGRFPDPKSEEKIFDSGGVWSLSRDQGKWIFGLYSPVSGPGPCQLVVFEPDFRAGDIHIRLNESDHRQLPFPLGYPLSEVVMVHLLSRGRGILLHACAVSDHGWGILFVGASGAGKSTLAKLWEGQEGVTLLSDDRVIVRRRGGRFWAYGTPWHGDVQAASPDAVPLERIFIIQHADENRAVPLSPPDAASHLLVRSFPTFWDAAGMAFTLEFLGQLSQAMPCYELGFVPDANVVDYVRCLK